MADTEKPYEPTEESLAQLLADLSGAEPGRLVPNEWDVRAAKMLAPLFASVERAAAEAAWDEGHRIGVGLMAAHSESYTKGARFAFDNRNPYREGALPPIPPTPEQEPAPKKYNGPGQGCSWCGGYQGRHTADCARPVPPVTGGKTE